MLYTIKSKYKVLLPFLLMVAVSATFLNVFMVDEELYDATRTGKIIFLMRYLPFLVLIGLPVLIYQVRKQLDILTLLVLAFYGWMWIVGKPGGIWNDEKFLYWTVGTICFLVTRSCITLDKINTTESNIFWIPMLAIVLVGGVEAVLGQLQVFNWYQIYHGTFKVTGTFFNPAPYAGFLVGCVTYALTLANPAEKTMLNRILSVVGLISTMLMISILPVTQSRAGWLGLVGACAVWSFYHFKVMDRVHILWTKRRSALLAGSGLMLVLILAAGYGMYHFKKESADGRLLIWKASSQLANDHPLTGYGFNTFQAQYAPVLADYFNSGKGTEQEEMLAGNVRWAFNELLQHTVELGVPGLLLFLGIIGCALLSPIKKSSQGQSQSQRLLHTARASLSGLIIFGLFSYPFHSPSITILFFFGLAVISGYSKALNLSYFGGAIQVALVILISIFAVYSFVQVPKLRNGYWLWKEADSLYKIKAYEAANESFEEAKPSLETNGLFMQQYGKSLYMTEQYEKAIKILEKSGRYYKDDFWYIAMGDAYKELLEYENAVGYYQQASAMGPHKLYSKYLLAKLYEANGQKLMANSIANDILASEVKVTSTAVKEIRLEMKGLVDQSMVQSGNEEQKVSTETLKPSAPGSPLKGKEVQR